MESDACVGSSEMQETSTGKNSTFVCTRNFGIAAVPAVNMFDSYIEPLTLFATLAHCTDLSSSPCEFGTTAGTMACRDTCVGNR